MAEGSSGVAGIFGSRRSSAKTQAKPILQVQALHVRACAA